MRRLTLFIPGLFEPSVQVTRAALPELPGLNWLLRYGRYQRQPLTAACYQLAGLLGLSPLAANDLPIAAISQLGETGSCQPGYWLCADPVHIHAYRKGTVLLGKPPISDATATAATALLKPVAAHYGFDFHAPNPYRWYLHARAAYQLTTTPLADAIGKDVSTLLPKGPDSQRFIQLLTDMQMTLHSALSTQQPGQQQALPINSVWLWGGGALPPPPQPHWSFIVTGDEVLGRGLAALTKTPVIPLQHYHALDGTKANDHGLINIDAFAKPHDELAAFAQTLTDYEKNWFYPIMCALQQQAIFELVLITHAATLTVNRSWRYKIWQRKKTLADFSLPLSC